MVSLTFDDGPDSEETPKVLEALRRAGVTATFFVVAEQIAESDGPALLNAVVDAGHVVQAHCGHHNAHDEQDLEALLADATEILGALDDHSVPRPGLWRPPYGRLNSPLSFAAADEVELQLVLWTHDTEDYRAPSWQQMHAAVDAAPLYDDSVILMHDSRRYASTESAENTAALIAPLVEHIRARGFDLAPLTAPVASRSRRPGETIDLVPRRIPDDR
jgi:peptidoglycan/xylan/chitin deacetylase (PgdA/CDA1 family)